MTGQQLIERLSAWLRQYVVLSEQQALVLALWALHTWVYDRFAATPYLEIMAETKRSGKTTLGECLSMLSQNGKMFATIRPLTIVRMIEALEGRVTVFIDEAEKLGRSSLDETRTMLATGYRRGQMHAVSVGSKFQEFPTFCPKAFMLIGNVQDVIRDRCIPIYLQRGLPTLMLTNVRDIAEEQASELVHAWKTFARNSLHGVSLSEDGRPRFATVDPVWLVSPRDREIWTPLFTLAHAMQLHKGTMEQLQRASVDFSTLKTLERREYHSAQDEQTADDRDAAARALTDLQAVLREDEKAVPSAVAVERMKNELHTSPWRLWRGEGLNEQTLAALLDRYGVKPENHSFGKGRKDRKVLKGYRATDIRKAKP